MDQASTGRLEFVDLGVGHLLLTGENGGEIDSNFDILVGRQRRVRNLLPRTRTVGWPRTLLDGISGLLRCENAIFSINKMNAREPFVLFFRRAAVLGITNLRKPCHVLIFQRLFHV